MSESTLALKYDDLAGEVGFFLGFGRGEANGQKAWSTKEKATIESCVRSGYRKFLVPPILPGEAQSYNWSFLHPTASISVASGQSTALLPDDFGGFDGDVTVTNADSSSRGALPLVNEGAVRQSYAEMPDSTGRPRQVALQAIKGTTLTKGQRYQLYLFPLTDATYVLSFSYYFLPDALTEPRPYALGGMLHAETVLEACLSVAEQRVDDASTVHTVNFLERLAASISIDRRNKPSYLGYNRDQSDRRSQAGRRGRASDYVVTYNGAEY